MVSFHTVSIDATIPVELLQRIFPETLPAFPDPSPSQRHPFVDHPTSSYAIIEVLAPLILSQVSRRWRRLAQEFPPLWTFIYVDLSQRFMPVPLIQTWLARSQQLPLKIACFFHPQDQWTPPNEPREVTLSGTCQILAQLFVCADRWQDVFFGVRRTRWEIQEWDAVADTWPEDAALGMDENGYFIFPSDFPFTAPHLRTLVVWPGLDSYHLAFIDRLLQSSAIVEKIELYRPLHPNEDDHFEWSFADPIQPQAAWQRLTTVSLSNITPVIACAFFRAAKDSPLEVLLLRLVESDEALGIQDTTTMLNRLSTSTRTPYAMLRYLRSLYLNATASVTTCLVDFIVAPALRKLDILLIHADDENPATTANTLKSSLAALMERSSRIPEQVALNVPGHGLNRSHPPHVPYPLDSWSPVSDIAIEGIPRSDFLPWMIRSASSLQTLSVTWARKIILRPSETTDMFNLVHLEHSPIFLPNLKGISVDLEVPRVVENNDLQDYGRRRNLLQHISAPALEKLLLRITHGGYWQSDAAPRFSPQLFDFVQRSNCSLTHLHLVMSHEPWAEDLIQLLSSNPTTFDLKTLVLESYPNVELLCNYLRAGKTIEGQDREYSVLDNPRTLPRLSHLVLTWDYNGHYHSPNGALANMLQWRFQEGGLRVVRVLLPDTERLQSVNSGLAKVDKKHVEVDENGLLALKEEGWNVQVATKHSLLQFDWFREAGTQWSY